MMLRKLRGEFEGQIETFPSFGYWADGERTVAKVPCMEHVFFTAVWDPGKENDIHEMIRIPVPALTYMISQINQLIEERNKLRDTLESARMG